MTGSRRVVAAVPDLMDRGRLAHPDVEVEVVPIARLVERVGREPVPDLVVVDLSRPGALEAAGVAARLGPRVVGFAPHVEGSMLERAGEAGVGALPRSRFFRRWPEVGDEGPEPPERRG